MFVNYVSVQVCVSMHVWEPVRGSARSDHLSLLGRFAEIRGSCEGAHSRVLWSHCA